MKNEKPGKEPSRKKPGTLCKNSLSRREDRIAGSLIMFCGECGTHNPDTNSFCKNCGKPMRKNQKTEPGAVTQAPPVPPLSYIPPAGGVPASVTAPAPAYAKEAQAGAVAPVPVKKRRRWPQILSLVISILSWILYPVILGMLAILTGIFALYMARKAGSKIPVSAVLAIIVGLLAIVLNFFWLDIFPPKAILPPIK